MSAHVIDQRIRPDGDSRLDGIGLLNGGLQSMIDANPQAWARARNLNLRRCVLEIDGQSWSLLPGEPPVVRSGVAEGKVMTLRTTLDEWNALVRDEVTPIGWMTAGSLDVQGGRIGHVLDWWLVLRAVLDDRIIYQPGDYTIDLARVRSFSLADAQEDMVAFLSEFGFLHIEGVFSQLEMDEISAEMDRVAPSYADGDGNSWWATLENGTRTLVRMQHFDQQSRAAARLLDGDRMLQIAAIPGLEYRNPTDRPNRIEALIKPLGVQEGISDIPWHKDCSLGRHSTSCCSLTVGISVSGADPDSGQLRVIPGSHRGHMWPALLNVDELGLPNIGLATRTGDVTVHLSCTLHMAQPPRTRGRRVMYTSFELPPLDPEAARSSRALLAQRREGAPRNTSQ